MTSPVFSHEMSVRDLIGMLNCKVVGQSIIEVLQCDDGLIFHLSGGSAIVFHEVGYLGYAEVSEQPCSTVIQ